MAVGTAGKLPDLQVSDHDDPRVVEEAATDDYSLTEEAAPPGFSRPMISLTFDDGSKGFWDNAREPLDAKGFKTTQYIPTLGLTSPDPFVMTRNQITTLAQEKQHNPFFAR